MTMLNQIQSLDKQTKNVGWVLLAIGISSLLAILVDDAFSSTLRFSIAFLISGTLVTKKKTAVAYLVMWIIALTSLPNLGNALTPFLFWPRDFTSTYIKLQPVDAFLQTLPNLFFLAALIWNYWALKVIAVQLDPKYRDALLHQLLTEIPRNFVERIFSRLFRLLDFIRQKLHVSFNFFWNVKGGLCLSVPIAIVIIAIPCLLYQPIQQINAQAIALASKKISGDYTYAVTNLHNSPHFTYATVYAYNKQQIKKIEVRW